MQVKAQPAEKPGTSRMRTMTPLAIRSKASHGYDEVGASNTMQTRPMGWVKSDYVQPRQGLAPRMKQEVDHRRIGDDHRGHNEDKTEEPAQKVDGTHFDLAQGLESTIDPELAAETLGSTE